MGILFIEANDVLYNHSKEKKTVTLITLSREQRRFQMSVESNERDCYCYGW